MRNRLTDGVAPARGKDWHALSVQEVIEHLRTDPEKGLTPLEAGRRLEKFGPNQLAEEKRGPFWKVFLGELREPLILLLFITGILYIVLGEVGDGIIIFTVILLLNTIEVVNEQRAKKAISALQKLAEPEAMVMREGHPQNVPLEQVVPGDVILLQSGRRVPADARLLEGYGLATDESSLSGESIPVDKDAAAKLDAETPLVERKNMLYSGTLVTRGSGKAVVIATDMQTEIGRVAALARQAKPPRTPLQEAMQEVSKSLIWLALGFSIFIPLMGFLIAHQPFQNMLLTGLSMAFATIPEEMPIIITMVLALGAYRLSGQNAIVRRLEAVETLGSVTVIATDKTGTLTHNRMTVSEVFPDFNEERIYTVGLLCNDVVVNENEMSGDPLEIALVRAAETIGLSQETSESQHTRVNEFSFDNERKRMSIVTHDSHGYQVWVKGAPESILAVSTRIQSEDDIKRMDEEDKQAVLDQVEKISSRGLRTIAFAEKRMPKGPMNREQAESQLTFLGLVGLLDPPREEVAGAIRLMQQAGVRTLMITGDHPLTARSIAQAIQLSKDDRVVTGAEIERMDEAELEEAVRNTSVFARATPEHKLRIVNTLQALDQRVAVTGDGVNDAPALAQADIGVAMGESGSDVAREAGDIVLADDNYTTIANAVSEGRHLFANLRKGVRYYLAIKVALVSVMLLPVLLRIPVPFAPIQIILMELFMDLAAAASFTSEPAEGDLMQMPPRDPKERFMDRAMVTSMLAGAAGLFAAVSTVYLYTWYRGFDLRTAQTTAFSAWMVAHVLLAFNLRSERQPILKVGVFSNRLMLIWGGVTVAFLALVTNISFLQGFLKTTSLVPGQWLLILVSAVVGTTWMEVWKLLTYRAKTD